MKKAFTKSIICCLIILCFLINGFPKSVEVNGVKENSSGSDTDGAPTVIYSSDTGIRFDDICPNVNEDVGSRDIIIRRAGEVSAPLSVKLNVYDNSAEYGVDYVLKQGGTQIEKNEGSTSIFNAFRDNGVLSSNLPIDAAEIYVAYADEASSSAAKDVNAKDMLSQIEEIGALVAEIDIAFGAGEAVAKITAEFIDDDKSEYRESFMLVLIGRDGNVIENTQMLYQIEDNDEAPTVNIEFSSPLQIEVNEESGVAQLEFTRTGNLATGTSALLLQNETPVGYVNFSPYQAKQVVIALPGTYRLMSDGNYTVTENSVLVKGDSSTFIPQGADPELDYVPEEFASLPAIVKGTPSITKFPVWVREGAVENDNYIVVMGDSSNQLFVRDGSSTDGNISYVSSSSNLYRLDTEGGASQGYLFSRTSKRYNLNGITSVEGSVYISDLTTGYCDVIFGVWNNGHDKIYTNDNDSVQNLKFDVDVGMGSQYIYYCNSDLKGVWDCGWNAYTPNGFKMNKREYDIFIMQPDALNYSGLTFAPTITAGSNKMTYTMHPDRQINISYVADSAHPARLVGYKLFNGSNMQYSSLISLSDSHITFDQSFLDKYDNNWGYNVTDDSGNVKRTFSILPVFEKIEVEVSIKESSLGSISLKNSTSKPCMGDTLVFEGTGTSDFPFSGVLYQCRKSAGGEILSHGVIFKVGDTATFKLDGNYGHYTFQGVFNTSADKLSVMYGDENPKGKLEFEPGVVLSGKDYRLSDYFPLMATPDDGFITVWESGGNYYFGDIFNYQLDGNYLNHDVSVRFLSDGDYVDTKDSNTKIVLSTNKISGKLTRNNWNLFDNTNNDIPLANTMYTITTSHGTYSGFTDENGNYSIENFTAVLGGTYSMAVSYQERIGYITFQYNGGGNNYNLSLPQFAVGGFYPVEVTATVSGQGYGSNTLNLTTAGTVQISSKIYIHSDEYKVTGVNFHFLSTLNSNYGDEIKVIKATYNENASTSNKYQIWTLDLSETSAVPKDTRIYVTVTAEYTYSTGVSVSSSTDLVDSGYVVELALNEEVVPIQQDIPKIPGVQSGSTSASALEIPIIGALDMSFSSKTGGYFVQQGSWKEAGDTYTLVCGHSIQPNYLVGTLDSKYKGAVATRDLLDAASSGDPQGKAALKQKAAAQIEIAPVFMLKFTINTVENSSGGLTHNLVGFEFAIGLDAFVCKNVPFNVYGVPCYICVTLSAEAYFQMQIELPQNTSLGSSLDNVITDLNEEAERDINAFMAAPIINFGVKGGVGWNGWASIFAEGSISAPFIIGFTPLDAAGSISFDIGIGADMMMFTAKIKYESDPYQFGSNELYGDLKTIQQYQQLSSARYVISTGESYDSYEDAINNAKFSIMERPQKNNDILQSGSVSQTVLAKNVFKNTNVQLVKLKNGNIMALFLTDNHAPDESFNYLSAAYAISSDNGQTWNDVEYISKNIGSATSSLQYGINVYELGDKILVTWSEADFDTMLQDVDVNNLSASQIAKLINAMNLKGRLFDADNGNTFGESFVIAENSAVFCGALDAVQNGENLYVYYQRNALVSKEDVTVESLMHSERTIAMAVANINNTTDWVSIPVRETNEDGIQYRITEVEPFIHDGILGEIIVIDKNGRLMSYDSQSGEMVPDIEDRQLYLRTYDFDENGIPTTKALVALSEYEDCDQSPQVVSNDDYLYLFWNHNGEIVYASDFVAKDTDDETTRSKALVIAKSNGEYEVTKNRKFSHSSIDGDESLHTGTTFTVSMANDGNVLICWIGNDKDDKTLVPTDEIYGIMLETRPVSDIVSDIKNAPKSETNEEYQLWAVGSPVALTDENRPIGKLDSICFDSVEDNKFLLAYTRLNNIMRTESTAADILAITKVQRPEISAEVEFAKYPTVGETETAFITVYNKGFEALNGYSVLISGIGEDISLKFDNVILPGRRDEVRVQIPVPYNFNCNSTLSINVYGLNEQSKYTAHAETEVLFGSYFVPMDIPCVNAVPNSDDCIIKVYVKNIGNEAGTPELEYLNRIYASDSEEDIVKYSYKADIVVTAGGEASITFTMTDTLIDRDKYSTVQVRMGDKFDQGTEAPMPSMIILSADDLINNGETDSDSSNDTDSDDEGEDTPKPGDKTHIIVFIMLSCVSVCGLICIYRKRKYVR